MPGLRSFCITAAVCIFFIFALQTSWTVAWLALDQRRIEAGRHGILPWLAVTEENKTKAGDTKSMLGDRLIHSYSDLFKYWPFKVIAKCSSKTIFIPVQNSSEDFHHCFPLQMLVLLVTGGLLSLGVFGSIHIVQRWDPGIVKTGISC